MIEGASPYKVFGRKKRSKCFKPNPRRVSWQSQRERKLQRERGIHKRAEGPQEHRQLGGRERQPHSEDVDRSKL